MGIAVPFRSADPRDFVGMQSPRYAGPQAPPHRHPHPVGGAAQSPCPYCQHAASDPPEDTILQSWWRGVRMVFASFLLIVMTSMRAARFMVAAAFCIVAVVGMAAQVVAQRIVHPADRRLLPR